MTVEPATTDLSVALVEHTNFAVSDRAGDMLPGTYHGFFVADTRYLSRLVLRLNGRPLEPLASGGEDHHGAGTFYLASPRLRGLPSATMTVFRDRSLSTHLDERIRIISYAREPIEVEVGLDVDADFADIFEVRGRRRLRRAVDVHRRRRAVRFSYEHHGYRRATTIAVDRAVTHVDGRLTVRARLEHGRPWDLNLRIHPELTHRRGVAPPPRPRRIAPALVRAWVDQAPRLETSDPRLARAWRRGVRDLASLLLTGPADRFIPAAGLPWFLAVFGRDSSITAMQTMLLGPEIPYGTLRALADFQGTSEDPWREEEPGKIPHEVRTGELATLGRIPFDRYYGSVDSTPLFLMLYAAVGRWSGWLRGRSHSRRPPPETVKDVLPAAQAALDWIERRVDAEGLLWYAPSRPGGITNQVWKDSRDSMRYRNGTTADPPIAAVEVQGYVVAARRGMADVYEALGRTEEAVAQRAAADRLAGAIEDRFWMPAEGTYALGLDRARRQINAVASNAGHLLWTDAVRADRAAAVAERLMAPDMFTGWGIRTLSSRNPGYNPIGYHVGAVWPHDSSIVASGLARAGQFDAAQRVIDGLLDAVAVNPAVRLPELFAGFDRTATPDLVPYPTACSPQAWATGAIFLSVRILLGIPTAKRDPRWRDLAVVGPVEEAWSMPELSSPKG